MEKLEFNATEVKFIIGNLKKYRDEIKHGDTPFRVPLDKATPEEHLALIEKLLPQLNEGKPCVIELNDRNESQIFASVMQNPKE